MLFNQSISCNYIVGKLHVGFNGGENGQGVAVLHTGGDVEQRIPV